MHHQWTDWQNGKFQLFPLQMNSEYAKYMPEFLLLWKVKTDRKTLRLVAWGVGANFLFVLFLNKSLLVLSMT